MAHPPTWPGYIDDRDREDDESVEDLIASLAPLGGWLAANNAKSAREVDEGAEADERATYGDADAEYDRFVEREW